MVSRSVDGLGAGEGKFPKALKLLKGAEFEAVFAQRRSKADATLIAYGCPNQLGVARLGLVVSKKCGNAVRRNRWKRVLREAFRTQRRQLPQGIDLVVLPRPTAVPTRDAVAHSLLVLAKRIAGDWNLSKSSNVDGVAMTPPAGPRNTKQMGP